jgi:hypothetical protein
MTGVWRLPFRAGRGQVEFLVGPKIRTSRFTRANAAANVAGMGREQPRVQKFACRVIDTSKKGRAFGNSVPEFFIDARTRPGKISPLVIRNLFHVTKKQKIWQ